MLSIIVAVADNGVIGRDNNLIWRLPSDLQRVKEITLSGSRTLIMGRKTFEALPGVLPGRKHIVITRDSNYRVNHDMVEIIHSIEELKNYIESHEEYFVFGGGEIYSLLLPYTSKMYITRVHGSFNGDTYFPQVDPTEWKITSEIKGQIDENNIYSHSFLTYERVEN
jgi:dihydrofolate reductase